MPWACLIVTGSRSCMTAVTSPVPWTRYCRPSAGCRPSAIASVRHDGQGRYLGLGVASYVEGTGVGPFESAIVRIEPTGSIYVTSGACAQGQGMETIFAQVVADTWSVDPRDVVISLGDTALIAIGFGTIASRSTVTLSGAIHYASERLRAKVFSIAGNMLECAPADLELRNGKVGVVGVPGMEVTLASVAQAARPGWDHRRPAGVDAGLEETFYWEPPTVTWSNATHLALVEVDIASGQIEIKQYVVAHDCGVVINPMLADGQIVGGTVQGLGWSSARGVCLRPSRSTADGIADGLCLATSKRQSKRAIVASGVTVSPEPLGCKGTGRGWRHCSACRDRERTLRRACDVQNRVQCNTHKAGTHRQGHSG